jgi:hypothetical protein
MIEAVTLAERWLFPPDTDAPDKAQGALRSVLREASISDGVTDDALIVINELVHATVGQTPSGAADELDVSVAVDLDKVRVEIAGGQVEDDNRVMRLVEELSDRWGVEHVGSDRVWFELNRQTRSLTSYLGPSLDHP